MTFPIFIAVLAAALLHASWNACIKTGANKQATMMILTVWQGVIGFCVILWRPFPGAEVWPWLIASGVVHMFYQLFLAYAYEQGDLSRVYPLARGAAPLMVVIAGFWLLPDVVAPVEYVGVAVLGLGILCMAFGALTSGENAALVPFALGSAVATASYTVIDGLGARVSGDPVGYVGWLLLMAALFYIPAVLLLRGRAVLIAPRRDWALGAFTGSASLAAYGIVIWAMTFAPIAVVAALRETSILFAVLIGWLFFGDKMNATKACAALLIISGVVLTRLA
jgi:drug/metabolite transporter (DMT)-like permease